MKQGNFNAVMAYPTESCYGLGCDPRSRRAVLRILRLKRRPQAKGLILIAADPHQLKPFVQPAALQQAVESGYWPGPVTLLLPASARCPVWVRGRHAAVAVRHTAHPPAVRLCRRLGTALVSTSANRSGQRALKRAGQVLRAFGSRVQVISGNIGRSRRPSMIKDLATGRILRK
ncbi:MAG: L-threonylcarbamoyladenylate synthase [Burkholderiales bacterium]